MFLSFITFIYYKWKYMCCKGYGHGKLSSNLGTKTLRFILAENHDTWHLTTSHIVSSFKITCKLLSKIKGAGRGTAILCHQTLTRSSAVVCATMPASFASASSVMNVPAVSQDQPFFYLCFINPSHE